MSDARASVKVGRTAGVVSIELPEMDPELRLALIAALAEDGIPLAKAVPPDKFDPRYPTLRALFERVLAIWGRWGEWLAQRIAGLLQSHRRGDPQAGVQLERVLSQYAAGVTADITGHTTSTALVGPLVKAKLLPADYHLTAPIPVAVRLGLAGDPHRARRPSQREPDPVSVVLPAHQAAIAAARSRAGLYLRQPIARVQTAAARLALEAGAHIDTRPLTDNERDAVRTTVSEAVATRAAAPELAARLRGTLDPTTDLERVARTELHYAHCHGQYAVLKAEAPEGAKVYKITNPGACAQCRRIWGNPSNPVIYALADVEAHDARGGNHGLKAASWGPTIGPTHPNCTCPPLQLWDSQRHEAVEDVAKELRDIFGTG